MESEILKVLDKMKRDGAWITLSLHPGIGERTIRKEAKNIFYINEGRGGKWEGISETFYDSIVNNYDSRCQK